MDSMFFSRTTGKGDVVKVVEWNEVNEMEERMFHYEDGEKAISFSTNHLNQAVIRYSEKNKDLTKGIISKVCITGEPVTMKGNMSTRTKFYQAAKEMNTSVSVKMLPDNFVVVSNPDKVNSMTVVMDWIEEQHEMCDYSETLPVTHLTESQRANIYGKCRNKGIKITMSRFMLKVLPPSEKPERETSLPFTKVFNAWVVSDIKPVHGFTTTLPVEVSSKAESMDHLRQTIYQHPYMLTFNPNTFEITFNKYKLKGTMGGTGLMRWTPAHGVNTVFFDPDIKPSELRNSKPTMQKLAFINKCSEHGIDFNEVIK